MCLCGFLDAMRISRLFLLSLFVFFSKTEVVLKTEVLQGGLSKMHMAQSEEMPSRFRRHWNITDSSYICRGSAKQTTDSRSVFSVPAGSFVLFPLSSADVGLNIIELASVSEPLLLETNETNIGVEAVDTISSVTTIDRFLRPGNKARLQRERIFYIALQTADSPNSEQQLVTNIRFTTHYQPRSGPRLSAEASVHNRCCVDFSLYQSVTVLYFFKFYVLFHVFRN